MAKQMHMLKKEMLVHTMTWVNLEYIMLSEKASHKKRVLYDSTYMRYLEQSKSESSVKVPRTRGRGNGELSFTGY